MDRLWITFSIITIAYVIILVAYFFRRSKSHEAELERFLKTAKQQIDLHKKQANQQANIKVAKAAAIVKHVQQATETFEKEAQAEYEQIVEDAKTERREILAQAKAEIEELFDQAQTELAEYKKSRQTEIERNLVKLVMSVTEKVVEISFTEKEHKHLIVKALEEVKENKKRSWKLLNYLLKNF